MSHTVRMDDYPVTCNKKKVEESYNAAARIAGRAEGSGGLGTKIRWNDLQRPLESREEAEQWIHDHDDGWYDQLAVTYYDIDPNRLTSVKYKSLYERFLKENTKVNDLERTLYPKTISAAFIGCKTCGSKLNKEFLLTNKCPVCGEDLRPKAMLNNIKWHKNKAKEILSERNEELNRLRTKAMKSKECVRWLVKVEWHE